MDGEAPTKTRKQKVTNQKAGWKVPLLLTLCLLQAANALKGPRLVSGEPGGDVTIKCHYQPTAINKHQRKYWCRVSPPRWICHTIVSSNHYTNLRYRGRVTLEDFPQNGMFVVRLFRLLPGDVGYYRCGIGSSNDMLFFSMNMTISGGPSSTIPKGALPADELTMRSSGTASPVANSWTPGATQTTEGQGTGWNRIALTPGTSQMTAPTTRVKTSETTGAIVPGTHSRVEGSIGATVSIQEHQTLKSRNMSSKTEDVWVWGTKNSVANRTREWEGGRETATTEAVRQREETKRVRIDLDGASKIIETIRPPTLISEKCCLQEATPVSRQPTLGSMETTPAPGMWTLETTNTETASAKGSKERSQTAAAGDNGPQATPSWALAAGPQKPLGKGSSMESSSPEAKSLAGTLTPVSAVLVPFALVALVLMQRKLWRKESSQEAERAPGVILISMTRFLEPSLQPDQLPRMEKMLPDDSAPTQASLPVPVRDPGPQGIEG
ncbi:high affinity immunoglobulin alpha and immunoglobulin mu Fc receptor [Tamandua tetradactyla]|uniref:high affinity immunoglobulin alpha and immunoglobulin mu Fc receptor n=1 Tax=Tamandua tetradactyla TaxID=48850 RepID=UPI00405408B4